jgi:hypothetical protein
MNKLIKILHVDSNWQVIYILIRDGILIKSIVPLEKAISMLQDEKFDLIISEPQKIALLDQSTGSGKKISDGMPLWKREDKISEKAVEFQPGRC